MESLGGNEEFSPSETNELSPWWIGRRGKAAPRQGQENQGEAGSTFGLRLSFIPRCLKNAAREPSEMTGWGHKMSLQTQALTGRGLTPGRGTQLCPVGEAERLWLGGGGGGFFQPLT